MQQQVYAVRDVKLGEYLFVIAAKNDVAIQRTYMEWVRNPNSPFGKHPKDYLLTHVCQFDSESGKVDLLPVPRDVTPHTEIDALNSEDKRNG